MAQRLCRRALLARAGVRSIRNQQQASYYVLVREEPPTEIIDTIAGPGLSCDVSSRIAGPGLSSSNALLLKLYDDKDREVASLASQRALSLSYLPAIWPKQLTARTLAFEAIYSDHAHISDTNLLLEPYSPTESRKLRAEYYETAAVVAVVSDQAGGKAGDHSQRAPVFFSSVESRSFFGPLLRLFS